ncbi:putative dNA polymerase V subunit UmuC [Mycobacterium xenopi 3993]|nr:putative dNA polymerase V subunit UmuC [Mycobacterium xenopi 3993]
MHLRTTNPIESTFSTVRNRSKITKGPAHARRESPWPTS